MVWFTVRAKDVPHILDISTRELTTRLVQSNSGQLKEDYQKGKMK